MGKNNKSSQKRHVQNDSKHSFDRLSIDGNIHRDRSNRPLTYVSENPDDFEPLTPIHLLLGRYNSRAVIEENDEDTSSRRRWK